MEIYNQYKLSLFQPWLHMHDFPMEILKYIMALEFFQKEQQIGGPHSLYQVITSTLGTMKI